MSFFYIQGFEFYEEGISKHVLTPRSKTENEV
jgi:hypothetical protein